MKYGKQIAYILIVPLALLIGYSTDSILLRMALTVVAYVQGVCITVGAES